MWSKTSHTLVKRMTWVVVFDQTQLKACHSTHQVLAGMRFHVNSTQIPRIKAQSK